MIRATMDGRPKLGQAGLLTKLEEMLDAKRVVFATKDGIITDEREVPDNSSQLRALNMALTLRDDYPHHAGVQVNSLAVVMERLPDLSHLPVRELARLAEISEADEVSDAELLGTEAQEEGAAR